MFSTNWLLIQNQSVPALSCERHDFVVAIDFEKLHSIILPSYIAWLRIHFFLFPVYVTRPHHARPFGSFAHEDLASAIFDAVVAVGAFLVY